MARGRRARATVRLNFEIAGIAALGVAVLLALALALPTSSGAAGAATARGLIALFGAGAWLAPLLVGLIGGIVFLEINVPQMIATLGLAAVAYFLILDAAFGTRGGIVGGGISRGLRGLFGAAGTDVVLVVLALLITLWITRMSLKRTIGWVLLFAGRARSARARALPVAAGARGRPRRARAGQPARGVRPAQARAEARGQGQSAGLARDDRARRRADVRCRIGRRRGAACEAGAHRDRRRRRRRLRRRR